MKCHQKKVSKIEHELNKIGRWIDLIEDHKDIVDSHLGNPNVQFYSDQHLCELVIETHKIILFKDKSYYQNLSLLYSKKKEMRVVEIENYNSDKIILSDRLTSIFYPKTKFRSVILDIIDNLKTVELKINSKDGIDTFVGSVKKNNK